MFQNPKIIFLKKEIYVKDKENIYNEITEKNFSNPKKKIPNYL